MSSIVVPPSPSQRGRTNRVAVTLASVAWILGSLQACSLPLQSQVTPATSTPAAEAGLADTRAWPKSSWQRADWSQLPGWQDDALSQWWPAWYRSCGKPLPGWESVCAQTRELGAEWASQVGDAFVRQWVESHFLPWHVHSPEGHSQGLLTGYFEPVLTAKRHPDARFAYPLYSPPAGLVSGKPYLTRAELEGSPAGQAALAGHELVWLSDPLDVLLIQVQGSGRVRLIDEPDEHGQATVVRLAFAAHNGQPYQSVGRWLVDQGAFALEQASWPAIRAWAQLHPQRVPEMLAANPRVVFFRQERLSVPSDGPKGASGLPLTPGRSIAVDRDSVPLGTPVWLVSSGHAPLATSPPPTPLAAAAGADSAASSASAANAPAPLAPSAPSASTAPGSLRRLTMAQDTGGAIQGAVRADFFWGWGDEALEQAGRTRQGLEMWALWPREPAAMAALSLQTSVTPHD